MWLTVRIQGQIQEFTIDRICPLLLNFINLNLYEIPIFLNCCFNPKTLQPQLMPELRILQCELLSVYHQTWSTMFELTLIAMQWHHWACPGCRAAGGDSRLAKNVKSFRYDSFKLLNSLPDTLRSCNLSAFKWKIMKILSDESFYSQLESLEFMYSKKA